MVNIKYEVINAYLEGIKECISKNNFTFANRRKNIDFLRDNGFVINDVKNMLLDLSHRNYFSGPEKDRDGEKEGQIWMFKYNFDGIEIYTKLRYDHPDQVVCISFHREGDYR